MNFKTIRNLVRAFLWVVPWSTAVAQVEWDDRTTAIPGPTDRVGQAAAYDAARRRAVLFGGFHFAGGTYLGAALGDTWEWDGTRWTQRFPVTSPAARWEHAMAYDAVRERVVLFGGLPRYGAAETWEWDGTDWSQRAPAVSPQLRAGHAMAFDAARQRVVLHGGQVVGGALLSDTWEWDGVSWTQRACAGPARRGHALAAAAGSVVLFSGDDGTGCASDTWVLGTCWTRLTPATSPPPRQGHAMAALGSRIVLFGGVRCVTGGAIPGADTWEWDGTNWQQRAPAAGPLPRAGHSMVGDVARGRVVMFGGSAATDTWEWDGHRWTDRTRGDPRPAGRSFHAVAYDAARGVVLLFGGQGLATALGDTWDWDGDIWTERRATAPANPPARRFHALAYDAARRRVVLFGGVGSATTLGDTWEWDGTTWIQRNPAVRPSPRDSHAMAYDSVRRRVVLFGGLAGTRGLGDTWEWDGHDWTLVDDDPALARSAHCMAYDAARQRLVVYGGQSESSSYTRDTWERGPDGWVQRFPATSPRRKNHASMAYDAARQRIVLFGGDGGSFGIDDDTWEWDGNDWTCRNPTAMPLLRISAAMAYDSARRRVVLVDGEYHADVWEYGTQVPARYASFGRGCAGSAGTPHLAAAAGELPWAGGPFAVEITNLPPGRPAVVAVGSSATVWGVIALPMSLSVVGMPGCTLYASLDATVGLANPSGTAIWSPSLPSSPSLWGQCFYNQCFVVDPGATPLGVTASNAGEATIGAR